MIDPDYLLIALLALLYTAVRALTHGFAIEAWRHAFRAVRARLRRQ